MAVIMGSKSDLPTMSAAISVLDELMIAHEALVVSAHRTPERLFNFAKSAHETGFKVIIAGAGGAAHLPGMVAALTHIPVIGVPVMSECLKGMDSLLSIVQMPKGTPVATMAIGPQGLLMLQYLPRLLLDCGMKMSLCDYKTGSRKLLILSQ
ncbi:phosphoribosylaminoimidazole carboxylase, catalytic subunit [Anaplasma phagocytophilum str. CR1007]|nr:phosphoribosylaminoimidazole carboxylase, catalytic subunit [Anaplasma phagocytophilum str. CR1007]